MRLEWKEGTHLHSIPDFYVELKQGIDRKIHYFHEILTYTPNRIALNSIKLNSIT